MLIGQTFGRETGFIAGSVRISDPDHKLPLILLLPEDQKDIDTVLNKVENTLSEHDRALIVLSEGYKIGDVGQEYDLSGQVMYGSSRTSAARLLVNACMERGIQAREYNPTVDQRLAIDDTLEFDLDIASRLGAFTVEQLAQGNSDFLASVADTSKSETLIAIPFGEIHDYSRRMPMRWIAANEFDVADEYLSYLRSFFKYSRFEKSYETYSGKFIFPADLERLD